MSSNKTNITDLFPVPSSPPSKLIPHVWPGVNPDSIAALREVLRDNHTRWHIFFNERGFHNHISHRALAIWALGADADVIKAGYKHDSSYQRPAFDPPEAITAVNFNDHIGDKRFYGGYLAFFTENIRQQGIASAVEQFVFAKEANFVSDSTKKQPEMFNRFLGGVIHPMIHIGNGLEFCLPGIVAEGLAEAATHSDASHALIPDTFFAYKASGVLGDAVSRLKTIVISEDTPSMRPPSIHVFSVLARILKDDALANLSDEGMSTTMRDHGEALIKYTSGWHVDGTNPRDVEHKIEELSWMNVMIYGIGGWADGKELNADFFHMHLVTSSLFLPSYAAFLTPSSLEHLLRSYLLVSLAWWVCRGRHALNIQAFFDRTSPHPTPSGALPTPHKETLSSADSAKAVTPNSWLPLIETAIVHPDDHLPKIQRALAHYGNLYGAREKGQSDFADTELAGAETLDGTLFLRVAGLTAKRLGRVREGEAPGAWGRVS